MEVELVKFIRSCGELEAMVESIRHAGFKTRDGCEILLENKKAILGHFLRLNRDFAKALTRAAEEHPGLQQTVRFFVADAQNVSKEVNDFFLKYPFQISSLQFASDYGKVFAVLLHSVHKHNAVVGLLEHIDVKKSAKNRAVNS